MKDWYTVVEGKYRGRPEWSVRKGSMILESYSTEEAAHKLKELLEELSDAKSRD